MTDEPKALTQDESNTLKNVLVVFGFMASFGLGHWRAKQATQVEPTEAITQIQPQLEQDVDEYYMKSYDNGVFVIEHGNRVLTAVCHASVELWPNCNRSVGTVGTILSQKRYEVWRMKGGSAGMLIMPITTAFNQNDVLEIISNKVK